MKKVVIALGLTAISLFANESVAHVSMSDTDFIPRVVNFVIFVGILWYLLADKIRLFYSDRSKNIANSFADADAKLAETKAQKEALKKSVKEAHKKAEEIVSTAKKETEIIKGKIIESAKGEIDMLNKQFNDQKTYEESKMKQEVVETYLNALVKDIHLSSDEVANIVTKKVG